MDHTGTSRFLGLRVKMNAQVAEILTDVLTYDHLADYLIAEFGHDFAVWPNGRAEVIESNIVFHPQDAPVARIQCPGIENLERSDFTTDFAHWDETVGAYIEDGTGRIIGDFEAVIRECCRDRTITGYMDDFRQDITESISRL
jgi:hypothetical protein